MMKDLDEAIQHCEEVAEQKEQEAKEAHVLSGMDCLECASEHRQLAEWLIELKKWRALRDSINMLCDVDCEYPQYRESGIMCDACSVGTIKEYFEQIFGEEANTDAEIHS